MFSVSSQIRIGTGGTKPLTSKSYQLVSNANFKSSEHVCACVKQNWVGRWTRKLTRFEVICSLFENIQMSEMIDSLYRELRDCWIKALLCWLNSVRFLCVSLKGTFLALILHLLRLIECKLPGTSFKILNSAPLNVEEFQLRQNVNYAQITCWQQKALGSCCHCACVLEKERKGFPLIRAPELSNRKQELNASGEFPKHPSRWSYSLRTGVDQNRVLKIKRDVYIIFTLNSSSSCRARLTAGVAYIQASDLSFPQKHRLVGLCVLRYYSIMLLSRNGKRKFSEFRTWQWTNGLLWCCFLMRRSSL